jgi:hypothetical protein
MLHPRFGRALDFDVPAVPAAPDDPSAVDASEKDGFPESQRTLAGRPVLPQTLSIVDNGETDKHNRSSFASQPLCLQDIQGEEDAKHKQRG